MAVNTLRAAGRGRRGGETGKRPPGGIRASAAMEDMAMWLLWSLLKDGERIAKKALSQGSPRVKV